MKQILIDTSIIVALITLLGTILTAFAPVVINWFSSKNEEETQ